MFRSSKCSIDLKQVYEWFNKNLYDISFFIVFQTDVKNQIYKLYELYFRADKEHNFGGNLKSIQEVEDRMFG